MTVRKAQKLRDALLISGAVMALLGGVYEVLSLSLVGIALIFSCIIPQILFIKCPHCGKQLGRNNGRFCQHCGKPIDK